MFILAGFRKIDTPTGQHPRLIGAPGGPGKGLPKGRDVAQSGDTLFGLEAVGMVIQGQILMITGSLQIEWLDVYCWSSHGTRNQKLLEQSGRAWDARRDSGAECRHD
jgi:hypothetical protein